MEKIRKVEFQECIKYLLYSLAIGLILFASLITLKEYMDAIRVQDSSHGYHIGYAVFVLPVLNYVNLFLLLGVMIFLVKGLVPLFANMKSYAEEKNRSRAIYITIGVIAILLFIALTIYFVFEWSTIPYYFGSDLKY